MSRRICLTTTSLLFRSSLILATAIFAAVLLHSRKHNHSLGYISVVRNEKKREKNKENAVPFGGIEAEAKEGKCKFEDPLGACGGFACDRHGEVEE